jgi:hypothetical protein
VATVVALGPLGWSVKVSLIAGTALSTTSLAVVYAVLVETRLNATSTGKLLMSACFVTDMCTALALSAIFITPNLWFPIFLSPTVRPSCRPSSSAWPYRATTQAIASSRSACAWSPSRC